MLKSWVALPREAEKSININGVFLGETENCTIELKDEFSSGVSPFGGSK